jgi:sec-independent protein translocase protein TatB
MFNIGMPEMLVIGFIGLIVFGPERLPELARNAAKMVARFRSEAARSINDLKEAADLGDLEADFRSIRSELTGAKDSINKSLREPGQQLKSLGKEVSAGGPTGHTPASLLPPPIDPEAT